MISFGFKSNRVLGLTIGIPCVGMNLPCFSRLASAIAVIQSFSILEALINVLAFAGAP